MKRVITSLLAFSLGIAMFAAACGGGTAETAPPAESQPPSGQVIDVSMGDNFFRANELTISAGQPVTISLKNDGSFVHNLRIAGADGRYDTSDDLVSEPRVTKSGDEGNLTVNLERGLYVFRCDFHPIEMVGQIAAQ